MDLSASVNHTNSSATKGHRGQVLKYEAYEDDLSYFNVNSTLLSDL